jgi:hypothetical protein
VATAMAPKLILMAVIVFLMVTGEVCWMVEAVIGVGTIDNWMIAFISILILNMLVWKLKRTPQSRFKP